MTDNQNPFDDTSRKVAELLEEVDEDDAISEGKFSRILEEVGITKGSFFRFVIFLIILFFAFNYFTSNKSVNVDVNNESVNNDPVNESSDSNSWFSSFFSNKNTHETPVNNVISPDSTLPSRDLGLTPGLSPRSLVTFSLSNQIGFERSLILALESYLLSYKKMKTIYDVDVRAYLDSKSNRKVSFEDYITEYNNAFLILKNNILKLEKEILIYKQKLAEVTLLTDNLEQSFLTKVDELEPYQLDALLSDYKEANLRKTTLTNELKSREIVFDRIANRNDIIESQLQGLLQNKDAIIKGVTFTNVQGSNINLSR